MQHKHLAIFNSQEIVEKYARQEHLQLPEQAILDVLRPVLSGARVLDIGVGGGRTTVHFAPLCQRYVGLDYAAAMIDACERRFRGFAPRPTFQLRDARDLNDFAPGSFDVVLFSFNGLDQAEHGDRQRILSQVARVCRPDGYFVFSSHNLASLGLRAALSLPGRRAQLSRMLELVPLRLRNRKMPDLVRRPYAVIEDLPGLITYYVSAEEQARQLRVHGFDRVRRFALRTGQELPDPLSPCDDPWVYYLCQRSGAGPA